MEGHESAIVRFRDISTIRNLAGELGAHFRLIGRGLGVSVFQRGDQVTIAGPESAVQVAVKLLNDLQEVSERGVEMRASDIELAVRAAKANPEKGVSKLLSQSIIKGRNGRSIGPRTEGQARYVAAIRSHDIVFGVGPAGTGKTYVAMAMAVSALVSGEVRRIVLTRPAVEAGEKLGFLPGDINEKVDPYLRPLFDAVEDMLPQERLERMMESNVIEVAPLAFMRGRTLDDAFVILDEAQNATANQMKMFLTRLGIGSKMVINGDITQVDLPRGQRSGLADALDVLANVPKVGVVVLDESDVVRHALVGAVIKAYRDHRGQDD
jgi:phosphate starvation-inducible PhoH-like protein